MNCMYLIGMLESNYFVKGEGYLYPHFKSCDSFFYSSSRVKEAMQMPSDLLEYALPGPIRPSTEIFRLSASRLARPWRGDAACARARSRVPNRCPTRNSVTETEVVLA